MVNYLYNIGTSLEKYNALMQPRFNLGLKFKDI